jgi:hypothetical protein
LQEWETAPVGLLERIVEYRRFAAAKHLYETTPPKDRPQSTMIDLVEEIDFRVAAEAIAAQKAADSEAPTPADT